MFVKVKVEDAITSKNPLMFSIDDNATIFDLKLNLESLVDIAADEQEIQRMDRILDNYEELSKVVNKETDGDKINGAAISLYTNNKFFCFLQFYNKNESDNQNNFFSQPSNAKKLPIDQLPQYIEQLDSDSSWHSSSSESDSSDQSSDSSEDSRRSKRKSNSKSSSPSKRSRDLKENVDKRCEPTSTTLLTPVQKVAETIISAPATVPEAAPMQSEAVIASQIPADQGTKNIAVVKVAPQAVVPISTLETTQNLKVKPVPLTNTVFQTSTLESSQNPKVNPIPATKTVVQTSTLKSSHNPKEKPEAPYVAMKPEQRRYAVVINKDIDEQQLDYGRLMEHFYGLFMSSRSCGQLNFSESPSITAHDDQLWVLCEDNETCEWIAQGARILSSYKCCSFIKYFGLSKCRVVLPQVVEGKELANIFQLLELQNLGLCTKKWCVVERALLDPSSEEYASQAMTTLCKNEVFTLYVDKESKCLIQELSYKLKYCFWKLTFQF